MKELTAFKPIEHTFGIRYSYNSYNSLSIIYQVFAFFMTNYFAMS